MYFDPTVMLPDSLNTLNTGETTPKEFSMMLCVKKCPDVNVYPVPVEGLGGDFYRMCK